MSDETTILLISLGFFIVILAIYILFILTLQNTLKVISPENRWMSPGAVWRLFIPLYNFYFAFVLVQNIADSIQSQLESSGEAIPESKPTLNIGIIWAIFTLANVFCNVLKLNDLSTITSLGALTFLILYWVKVAAYKKKIIQLPAIMLDAEVEQLQNAS